MARPFRVRGPRKVPRKRPHKRPRSIRVRGRISLDALSAVLAWGVRVSVCITVRVSVRVRLHARLRVSI
eukprot:1433747-Alexandrium_andersonii.AAC.1